MDLLHYFKPKKLTFILLFFVIAFMFIPFAPCDSKGGQIGTPFRVFGLDGCNQYKIYLDLPIYLIFSNIILDLIFWYVILSLLVYTRETLVEEKKWKSIYWIVYLLVFFSVLILIAIVKFLV